MDIMGAFIVAIGILLWLMRGWGRYFCSFNGDIDTYLRKGGDVGFVNKLTYKIYGYPLDKEDITKAIRNWGTIAMSLRGSLMSIPLFSALAIHYSNPIILLGSVIMLIQGLYYRWIKHYGFTLAEKLTGFTYSGLIVLSGVI
jgi:hypothetical protein